MENWTHDFNIGSMVRTANAFQAKRVHIVGPHKWNRKGALMTELYQHVENHPSITELVECWKLRIAGEIAAAQSQASAIALHMHENAESGHGAGMNDAASLNEGRVAECAPSGISMDVSAAISAENGNKLAYMTQLAAIDQRIAELKAARVIALDIIPGAVPMETYCFPKRCLMLFGAEGPGLSEKALELADDVVYISQFGSVRSINAGAAAAVSMHAWIAQHAAPQS
ncbi:TrmH family RNA methyltransferase [Bifidobacterium catenulatum]|uniref:TrmH family RNA methyltransferase n=1 Tax=Bifidobacterium catenulatum TaxID=1686 RepID=UPI0037C09080